MKKRKISQKDIAILLGLSSNAVNYKLRGKREFTASEMFKIKDSYFKDISIEDLFKTE